jgi:rare lipoprotein A
LRIVVLALLALLFFTGCAKKYEVRYNNTDTKSKPSSSETTTKSSSSSSASNASKMKPYDVFGKTYYPSFVSIGEEFNGIASWYGPDFHGKKTANGENYDMNADTAAHKTLPMNTMVRVTNLNNSKSVVVRINDRGPFVDGRIIDLSYAAGKSVGIDKTGTAPVKLTVLGFDSTISKTGDKASKSVSGIAVQIGAFRNKSGADEWAAKYVSVNGVYKAVVKTYDFLGSPMYRVMLSGFRSEAEARDFIKEGRFAGSFVVSLD